MEDLIHRWIQGCHGVKYCDQLISSAHLWRCQLVSYWITFTNMDKSWNASRILTAVIENDCKRLAGRPHTCWLATMKRLKDNLSLHNISVEDVTKLALDRSLWRLLAASGATHWIGASWTMMTMMNVDKVTRHRQKLSHTQFDTVDYSWSETSWW